MAPVYEYLHNKRLCKQNGMSLLTSRCLLCILNITDEQFFPYSYVCRGNILKKNASKNCKQLALAQRNGYRVLPLATVATEKPRFRAHAAIFAIGVTRAREITARGVVWGNVGCVAPLPCRPRLCRPNRSYVAPTSELCRPNIVVVSPQHQRFSDRFTRTIDL